MRLLTLTCVFVIAILTAHVDARAEETPASPVAFPTPAPEGNWKHAEGSPAVHNGFDQYRQLPNLGAPSSPASGFKHFPFRMHMFTTWHRPKAATLTKDLRCKPAPFRPRGLGVLFTRPHDCFRMDYSPHTLEDPSNHYGPSYYGRVPDPRCDRCGH